eukprot:4491341-Alexandrium_andersonii.AAC.1
MEARATGAVGGGKSRGWTCADQVRSSCEVEYPRSHGRERSGPGEVRWNRPALFPAPLGVRGCPPRLGHLYH